jgi:hypothetical protein
VRLLLFFGGGVLVRFSLPLLFGETFPLSLNKAATNFRDNLQKQKILSNKKFQTKYATKSLNNKDSTGKKVLP